MAKTSACTCTAPLFAVQLLFLDCTVEKSAVIVSALCVWESKDQVGCTEAIQFMVVASVCERLPMENSEGRVPSSSDVPGDDLQCFEHRGFPRLPRRSPCTDNVAANLVDKVHCIPGDLVSEKPLAGLCFDVIHSSIRSAKNGLLKQVSKPPLLPVA
ncbi:uncharacterized protein PHACADRAFT_186130 [Phanerochaete carnosa HHB-10118-sp]|uniref:Uncharacterized protein n=1 Tax=Phanerochaete carnosa (strain HHB-10118-sp) TaxID=650164 RepID=K5W3G3_PHACS|nr:uncharacterized protein PHACADRAFT_186130 [Phanerochaete carnosa HHB-10118-sp]EKM53459.1 hypothetical protein PHACADRAFT_186130 [Phanerochaete carnosa HHB-10118-sp]